jgi:Domain of unknown function (DUF222)
MDETVEALLAVDPRGLDHDARLSHLEAIARLEARVAAGKQEAFAAIEADPPARPPLRAEDVQRWVRHEVACVLRLSTGMAATLMIQADILVQQLPATHALLKTGAISFSHARILIDGVRQLDPTVAAKLEKTVLARAPLQSPAEFRRSVRTTRARLDPRTEQEQHRDAAAERRVCLNPDDAAMAWLNAYLPAADAQTIMTAAQAVADRTRALFVHDPRSADQLRADALVAICAAVLNDEPIAVLVDAGLPRWQGRRPNIDVVVALSTLLDLDDQPGDLVGYGPIPADVARRMAADPTGTWRRLVTDQLGHIIDYGRTVYRPPADLRDFVTARDRTCRGIGCHRRADRCEIDHEIDWDDGGETNQHNLSPKCPRDHHLKHDAGWHTERLPDGTTRWTTPTGRVYDKPPDNLPTDRTRPKHPDQQEPEREPEPANQAGHNDEPPF